MSSEISSSASLPGGVASSPIPISRFALPAIDSASAVRSDASVGVGGPLGLTGTESRAIGDCCEEAFVPGDAATGDASAETEESIEDEAAW